MHQWLEHQIDDGLIGFRAFSVRNQGDVLAELPRHVPHQAGERPKNLGHRHHSQSQHGTVEFACEPLQGVVPVSDGAREIMLTWIFLNTPGEMREAVLHDQKFAGEIDQRIDSRFSHSQRTAHGTGAGRARRLDRT